MEKLTLNNFKAHTTLEIPFDNKNFLLYGDNGAGKSSIYEALKLCFFRERMEQSIPNAMTSEEKQQNKQDFYAQYNNQSTKQDFTIEFNSELFPINTDAYHAYMLSLEDMYISGGMSFEFLLSKVFFPSETGEMSLLTTDVERFKRAILGGDLIVDIQEKSNAFLHYCLEAITIEIDRSDGYAIKLQDDSRSIASTKEIKKYFNEGKINLVVLALLFSAIEVTKNPLLKNVLILDDFITSLDMSNRTFLMRYILETFKEFQIVILTHNVYFYNLIMYLVNDIYGTKDKWQFANLYEIGNEHKIYINSNYITVDMIEADYKKPSSNLVEIGNKLRQKFERLLYELSKIMMIGGVEESDKILSLILNSQNIYLKKENKSFKNADNLVNELTIDPSDQAKIDAYKLDELPAIQEILKTLKLYRKVSMHSLSHGQTGQHNWSDKEIEQTLILLRKLEANLKDLTSKSVN